MRYIFILACFAISQSVFSQDCKVLMLEIAEAYEGECKKGLAQGHGKAEGEDKYEGQFKKGLPHGDGKYVWSNGDYFEGNWSNGQKEGKGIHHMIINGQESVLTGFWKDDVYVGEERVAAYTVNSRRMVDNIRVTKIAEGNNVRFRFKQMGNKNPTLNGLYISTFGNGNVNMASHDSMVENPTFPMKLLVEYTSITTIGGNSQSARIEMTFNVPGVWQITFTNK